MSELTSAQITAIQGLTSNVETAYRALQRSRTALSYLINMGQATCNDVVGYNRMVQATFYYQKSIAEIIRASGGSPPSIVQPLYVAYKGKTGDAAVNIDCAAGQLSGWRSNGLGDFYVNPAQLEWKAEATPSDNAAIQQLLAGFKAPAKPGGAGQLGNPLLLAVVPIILWGIVVAVAGYIVLKIVESLTDVPQKQEHTRQVAIAAERHAATLEARQKCYADCVARGKDPAECAKNCTRLNPGFEPPSAGFSLGIVGKVVTGAALIGAVVVGVGLIRRYALSAGPSSGSGPRRQLGPGDDDDDDGDYIDAEYEES